MSQKYIDLAITILALYAAWKYRDDIVAAINSAVGGLGSIGGGAAPGGGGAVTATGDTPYPGTNPQDLPTEGQGTRHYASGKSDDVTQEWEGETSAQSYMVVYDITITEIDHDDTVTCKFGGTHMGSGWYELRYTFEAGQSQIGAEESHPNSSDCTEGTAIGTFVNTRRKIACVNMNKGERLEMWSHNGSAWQKDGESANGVCGFRPNVSTDEIQIRIDGAPGITMHSALVYELASGATPGGGGGGAPAAPAGGGEEEDDN